MKKQSLLISIMLLLKLSVFANDSGFYALFSPVQGEQAFEKIYKMIETATEEVSLTIYSWSDKNVVDAINKALENGAQVRVVLHRPLYNKSRVKDMVREIELNGAIVKISHQNMHEKFIIVDNKELMNSSANLSSGAKTKYSENFIFHTNETEQGIDLIGEFTREFAILFNSAKDVFTTGEQIAKSLPLDQYDHNVIADESALYSSSMNFSLSDYRSTSATYKQGRYVRMTRIKDEDKEQIWTVRDKIIEHINKAQTNIYASLNHLNIESVAVALVNAAKRGVDVRLAVDNQEYKSSTRSKEKTPLFVSLWKKLPGNSNKVAPVRVTFYSHAPSPRYWFLNHHKYFLIDYNNVEDKADEKTVLISGSYNVSKNAEHRQYDNMVVYQGETHGTLYKQFLGEFNRLWFLNRTEEDKPDADIYKSLSTPDEEGILYIHSKTPMSLTWREVRRLRSKVSKIAKGLYYKAFKYRNCYVFNTKTSQFGGCPR